MQRGVRFFNKHGGHLRVNQVCGDYERSKVERSVWMGKDTLADYGSQVIYLVQIVRVFLFLCKKIKEPYVLHGKCSEIFPEKNIISEIFKKNRVFFRDKCKFIKCWTTTLSFYSIQKKPRFGGVIFDDDFISDARAAIVQRSTERFFFSNECRGQSDYRKKAKYFAFFPEMANTAE